MHTMTGVYLEDNQLTCNQLKILMKQAKFYKKLFKSNKDIKFVLQNDTDTRVMDIDKALLEEDLTLDEIFKAMKSMPNWKSPGCNGLTVESFKCFWENMKKLLFKAYKYAFEHDILHISA